MKNLLYLFAIILFTACGSDDDSVDPIVETTNGITTLDATGTVSEQTPVEAKKTIYGKWNFSNTARGTSNTCTFSFIEFTDDYYIMGFSVNQEIEAVFGTYELNTDANGFVTSVDLNLEMSDTTIASLTNIVVTETNEILNATFTIELNIPEDSEYMICNNLEGDYSTNKGDPMDESDPSDTDSNHAKLISTWTFVLMTEDGVDISNEWYDHACYDDYDDYEDDYEEGCTPSTEIKLTFSAYGTYTFVFYGSSNGTKAITEPWSWSDETQTSFYVGDGDELISIESLTDMEAIFSSNQEDEGEVESDYIYSFSAE